MTPKGFALPFTLVLLSLGTILVGTGVYLRTQGSLAARERALLGYHRALLGGAGTLIRRELYGRFLPQAKAWAQTHMASSGYAFGGTSQASVANALTPLAQDLHALAEGLCTAPQGGVVFRVYFRPAPLCGVPPPEPPAPPYRVSADGGLEVYALPWVALLTASTGENRRTQILSGELRLYAGSPNLARFQVFLRTAHAPDGTPSYFRGGEVYEGPVYVGGTPNFGQASPPGPFFLGGFFTGRCQGVDPSGCLGTTLPVGFESPTTTFVGVEPEAMFPSPLEPCYGAFCPRFPGGVDWDAPVRDLPAGLSAPPAFWLGGNPSYQALLFLGSGTPPAQGLVITPQGGGSPGTLRFRIEGNRLLLERRAGENLLAASEYNRVGWWGGATASGGLVTLRNRDGYYGGYIPIPTGQRLIWTVSFEANADGARGPVQVGINVCRNFPTGNRWEKCYNWIGSRWRGGGQGVYPGEGWKRVTASFITPADAFAAVPWIQIDAPWGNTGVAYLRNLRLSVTVDTLQPVAPTAFAAAANPTPPAPPPPILMVEGNLDLAGTPNAASLEGNTSFTLGATGNVRILSDLLTTHPPCRTSAGVSGGLPVPSDCPGTTARGLFGVYAEGDILLARSAPQEVYLTASLFARGTFGPEGAPQAFSGVGRLHLTGSIAAANYKSFHNRQWGWRLLLSYDPRLKAGGAPPGWPTLPRGVYGGVVLIHHEEAF